LGPINPKTAINHRGHREKHGMLLKDKENKIIILFLSELCGKRFFDLKIISVLSVVSFRLGGSAWGGKCIIRV
jgi:hypothetical protein